MVAWFVTLHTALINWRKDWGLGTGNETVIGDHWECCVENGWQIVIEAIPVLLLYSNIYCCSLPAINTCLLQTQCT